MIMVIGINFKNYGYINGKDCSRIAKVPAKIGPGCVLEEEQLKFTNPFLLKINSTPNVENELKLHIIIIRMLIWKD